MRSWNRCMKSRDRREERLSAFRASTAGLDPRPRERILFHTNTRMACPASGTRCISAFAHRTTSHKGQHVIGDEGCVGKGNGPGCRTSRGDLTLTLRSLQVSHFPVRVILWNQSKAGPLPEKLIVESADCILTQSTSRVHRPTRQRPFHRFATSSTVFAVGIEMDESRLRWRRTL